MWVLVAIVLAENVGRLAIPYLGTPDALVATDGGRSAALRAV